MTEKRVPYQKLCDQVAQALIQAQVPAELAGQEALIMAEADLLGVPSHGVRMLPPLLKAIRDGRIKANPDIRILRSHGATCVLDTDNGPGRSASAKAMEFAMQRAREFGIGACLARRTTHWGRAHAYAWRAAREGLIGFCTTNAIPTMAGWNAKRKIIGNNPLAFGIPRKDQNEPLVLDMAMSQAAVGKVNTWQREGRGIPDGWGIDANGNPSNNAQEILKGAVLPFGGHKGAGLALVMELITAALGGGSFGNEISADDPSGLDPDACKLFIALNPEVFCGLDTLTRRAEEYFSYLAEQTEPGDVFVWPGQRGWQERNRNLSEGVPLHVDIIAQLEAEGVLFGSV